MSCDSSRTPKQEQRERQATFDAERGAIFSAAIGIARLKLREDDIIGASAALDMSVVEACKLMHEFLAASGLDLADDDEDCGHCNCHSGCQGG